MNRTPPFVLWDIEKTSEGDHPHDVTGFSSEQVINDILKRYARFRQTRHLQ